MGLVGFAIRAAKEDSELCHLATRIAGQACDALLDKRIRPDMHPLSCFIRLLQALRMKGYRAKPSQFIRSKKSIFYEDNQTKAAAETEYILREQEEDGTWPVVWSWPDYPEAWAVGRMWWESHIVIENLRYLQGMGRLAIRD